MTENEGDRLARFFARSEVDEHEARARAEREREAAPVYEEVLLPHEAIARLVDGFEVELAAEFVPAVRAKLGDGLVVVDSHAARQSFLCAFDRRKADAWRLNTGRATRTVRIEINSPWVDDAGDALRYAVSRAVKVVAPEGRADVAGNGAAVASTNECELAFLAGRSVGKARAKYGQGPLQLNEPKVGLIPGRPATTHTRAKAFAQEIIGSFVDRGPELRRPPYQDIAEAQRELNRLEGRRLRGVGRVMYEGREFDLRCVDGDQAIIASDDGLVDAVPACDIQPISPATRRRSWFGSSRGVA